MSCIMLALRMGLIVCAALLTAQCTSPPGATAEATWTGYAGTNDFNLAGNWNPPGVPKGIVAIIDLLQQGAVFVYNPVTPSAVKLTGNVGLVVTTGGSVTASGGFTVCCGTAKMVLADSKITGDVAIGSASAVTDNAVGGAGVINGNILQYGGKFGADGTETSLKMTVAGDYRSLGPNTGFVANVLPSGRTTVEVSGLASIDTATLVVFIDSQVTGQIAPFKVLTAKRINGKFKNALVIPSGSASVSYTETEATVTVRR